MKMVPRTFDWPNHIWFMGCRESTGPTLRLLSVTRGLYVLIIEYKGGGGA